MCMLPNVGVVVCRWNTLASGTTGIELTLMPMLLGFLTYKGAVIAKGAVDLFSDLSGSSCPLLPRPSPTSVCISSVRKCGLDYRLLQLLHCAVCLRMAMPMRERLHDAQTGHNVMLAV